MKHSELPWEVSENCSSDGITKSSDTAVFRAFQKPTMGEMRANAAFIVKAVNERESLIAALKDIVTQYPLVHGNPVPAWIRNAQEAIKEAE